MSIDTKHGVNMTLYQLSTKRRFPHPLASRKLIGTVGDKILYLLKLLGDRTSLDHGVVLDTDPHEPILPHLHHAVPFQVPFTGSSLDKYHLEPRIVVADIHQLHPVVAHDRVTIGKDEQIVPGERIP